MLDTEQELIQGAKRGEPEAFGKLYDHYLPKIYRYIFAKINHREEAEDILHEVFLSAWQNIRRYAEKGLPFSSWLYRIAHNRVVDHYRLKKKVMSLDDIDPDSVKLAGATDETLDGKLVWERVRRCLDELEDHEQEVLILRFVNDLTPREIAAILGKNEGAVRVMQHRAILALKKLIKES